MKILKRIVLLTVVLCLTFIPAFAAGGAERLVINGKNGSTNQNDGFIRESYVRGGLYKNNSFNTEPLLLVGDDGTADNTCSTYLRVVYYKAVSDTSKIRSAKLRLCIAEAPANSQVSFYPTHNAFDENITYERTPEKGFEGTIANAPVISTVSVGPSSVDKWIEIDVTDYIKNFEALVKPFIVQGAPGFPPRNASFRISSANAETGAPVKFYSTRHGDGAAKGPQLVIIRENDDIDPVTQVSSLKLVRSANSFSLKASYKNTEFADMNTKAIIAYYGNRKLLKADTVDYSLLSGYIINGGPVISADIPEGADTVKGFLWDGFSYVTPLSKCAVADPDAPILSDFTVFPSGFTYVGTNSGMPFGSGTNQVRTNQDGASGPNKDLYVFSPGVDGKYVEFTFEATEAGEYALAVRTKTDTTRGKYDITINSVYAGQMDGYAPVVFVDRAISESVTLEKGTNTIRFTGNGKSASAKDYILTVDCLKFSPAE